MNNIKLDLLKKKVVSILVIGTLSIGSLATPMFAKAADGVIDDSCCENGSNGDACRALMKSDKDAQAILRGAMIDRVKPVPASVAFSQGSCLDTLMNTRININFSVMAADQIIQAILNSVKNAACGAVMGAWNQALSKVNGQLGTSVNIPGLGNIGQSGVGVGYGTSSSAVNMQGNGIQNATDFTTSAATSTSSAASSISNGAASVTKSSSGFASRIRGLFN